MKLIFREWNLPKGTRPYTIEVDVIIGRVVEDNHERAVLISTFPDETGDWQLTMRNHAEIYSGRIEVEE